MVVLIDGVGLDKTCVGVAAGGLVTGGTTIGGTGTGGTTAGGAGTGGFFEGVFDGVDIID